MKTPGPDHPITLEPAANRWRARFAGEVIADSAAAVILREAGYPPRVYFPRADVAMRHLTRSEATTHCPYKGDAAYYTVRANGRMSESAVWTYEQPYPAMAGIKDLLSFYPDRVEVYEIAEPAVSTGG
ncbi:DUF427 domain-containing protein [Phenylobacterium sp.]|uniref:DUF427 domain-containing protein n=1 Tax=Phenylobacterium sp. TaxID=1871053 RepID=UPI00286CE9E0|nr:DUF427 domain-containing protein [Phenylobacterium sp.]